MNYINIKVTVWNRVGFSEETDMQRLGEIINDQGIDVNAKHEL